VSSTFDFLLWYAKDKNKVKYHQLYLEKKALIGAGEQYEWTELPDGSRRRMTSAEKSDISTLPHGSRIFTLDNFTSQHGTAFPISFEDKTYLPGNGYWKTSLAGVERLKQHNRLVPVGTTIRYVRYIDDFPLYPVSNFWDDTRTGGWSDPKIYVVQTGTKTISRCILMTTDPGDLVVDPTCGGGTTAYAAEKWGRRWITCDTSRISISLAKQRLMTALFDYYELYNQHEGVSSGFRYESVPHTTLKSIVNNEPPVEETLYDRPFVDNSKSRVSGPFTVEAVPSPTVRPLSDPPQEKAADESIVRSGDTLRQSEWRDELLKTGIRGKGGQYLHFSRLEPLSGTRWLHADGETKEDSPKRVVISFGPEHSPLEQRQVALAIEEGLTLVPPPNIVVFAAFQFDAEAAKDIDEAQWPGVVLLKAQMNADLQTEDLKKRRASNESFWLIGQPDVRIQRIPEGPDLGKYRVEVFGFDYYNTRTGNVESGGAGQIAMWMLDTDYDGRSVFPEQVFFPLADEKGGWSGLSRSLKAEIDPELVEAYHGTISLPFEIGSYRRIAVKVLDDRGIESLRIIEVE